MRRTLIGISALILLATWAGLEWFAPGQASEVVLATCSKLGASLAVLWLALPEVDRPHNQMWLAFILVAVLVLVARPRLLPLVLVVFVVLAILRPRKKPESRSS